MRRVRLPYAETSVLDFYRDISQPIWESGEGERARSRLESSWRPAIGIFSHARKNMASSVIIFLIV